MESLSAWQLNAMYHYMGATFTEQNKKEEYEKVTGQSWPVAEGKATNVAAPRMVDAPAVVNLPADDEAAGADPFKHIEDVENAKTEYDLPGILASVGNNQITAFARLVAIAKTTTNQFMLQAFKELTQTLGEEITIPGRKEPTNSFALVHPAKGDSMEEAQRFILNQALAIVKRCNFALSYNAAQKSKATRIDVFLLLQCVATLKDWTCVLEPEEVKSVAQAALQLYQAIAATFKSSHPFARAMQTLTEEAPFSDLLALNQHIEGASRANPLSHLPAPMISYGEMLGNCPGVITDELFWEEHPGLKLDFDLHEPPYIIALSTVCVIVTDPSLAKKYPKRNLGSVLKNMSSMNVILRKQFDLMLARLAITKDTPDISDTEIAQWGTLLRKKDQRSFSTWAGGLLFLNEALPEQLDVVLKGKDFDPNLPYKLRCAWSMLNRLDGAYNGLPLVVKKDFRNARLQCHQAWAHTYANSRDQVTKVIWEAFKDESRFFEVFERAKECDKAFTYAGQILVTFQDTYLPLSVLAELTQGDAPSSSPGPSRKSSPKGGTKGRHDPFIDAIEHLPEEMQTRVFSDERIVILFNISKKKDTSGRRGKTIESATLSASKGVQATAANVGAIITYSIQNKSNILTHGPARAALHTVVGERLAEIKEAAKTGSQTVLGGDS